MSSLRFRARRRGRGVEYHRLLQTGRFRPMRATRTGVRRATYCGREARRVEITVNQTIDAVADGNGPNVLMTISQIEDRVAGDDEKRNGQTADEDKHRSDSTDGNRRRRRS